MSTLLSFDIFGGRDKAGGKLRALIGRGGSFQQATIPFTLIGISLRVYKNPT